MLNFSIEKIKEDFNYLVNYHPNCPIFDIDEDCDDEDVCDIYRKYRNLDSKVLDKLSDINNILLLQYISNHKNTSSKTLQKIFNKQKLVSIYEVDEYGQQAVYSKNWRVLIHMTNNLKCSQSILTELSLSDDANIRRNVARNENTPVLILRNLLNDSYDDVKREAASNANIKIDLIVKILKNSKNDPLVLIGLVKNPNITIQLLVKLSKHYNDAVAFKAKEVRRSRMGILK